jgi:hypothetical protein
MAERMRVRGKGEKVTSRVYDVGSDVFWGDLWGHGDFWNDVLDLWA